MEYREKLQQELSARCSKNPSYSLRAFSRDLGLSAPRLSQILNGRSGLSKQLAEKIAQKIGWSTQETAEFCDRVEAAHGRSPSQRKVAAIRLKGREYSQEYKVLALDRFRIVSDWYHMAILELLELDGFEPTIPNIAKALGIHESVADAALKRLTRAGFLNERFVATPNDTPHEAIREFHTQMLEKAKQALHAFGVDEREFGGTTLAIDSHRMPEAKEMIRSFRKQFTEAMNTTAKNRDAVYQISIQFFPLARPALKKEK